jgi:hypothetical protein
MPRLRNSVRKLCESLLARRTPRDDGGLYSTQSRMRRSLLFSRPFNEYRRGKCRSTLPCLRRSMRGMRRRMREASYVALPGVRSIMSRMRRRMQKYVDSKWLRSLERKLRTRSCRLQLYKVSRVLTVSSRGILYSADESSRV